MNNSQETPQQQNTLEDTPQYEFEYEGQQENQQNTQDQSLTDTQRRINFNMDNTTHSQLLVSTFIIPPIHITITPPPIRCEAEALPRPRLITLWFIPDN